MRKLRPHHLTPCLLSVGLFCSPAILAGENFSDLFTDAKPILDLRYRYEHIDQDNALKHANAQTLRTRIGFQTGRASMRTSASRRMRVEASNPIWSGSMVAAVSHRVAWWSRGSGIHPRPSR